MKGDEDFCPILKRAWKDTMELARQMAERQKPAHHEETDGSTSKALPSEEKARHQTLEVAFDLTKGGFPCYRK